MKDNEIATLMNETAGQHWGTEHHFRRFAYILLAAERKRQEEQLHTCSAMCDKPLCAARRRGVEAERHRCVRIARQWDADHPDTNYGGCIARLIEGTNP
jgi:hypothetical protein